ncbi:MAG: Holliday junction branch migration protein RuvA [Bacteroidetes bacterium]|jgi:Holliday junction DNA helicase RuvA|nr:Holliday junction branch migration protein RuvA [Bacteroidota bacterium]
MIAQLRGEIVRIDANNVIIDVGGVGYSVTVSGRTQTLLAPEMSAGGEAVTLLTDMQVREDSMTLFGFLDIAERDAFRLLVTVQGVGAKAAMSILSVLSPDDLAMAIMAADKAMVARADGVGPKLALRVVNELAEKIGGLSIGGGASGHAGTGSIAGTAGANAGSNVGGVGADAISALVNLGYGRAAAHGALQRVRAEGVDSDDLSALIAAALKELGR